MTLSFLGHLTYLSDALKSLHMTRDRTQPLSWFKVKIESSWARGFDPTKMFYEDQNIATVFGKTVCLKN